jgi:hypothetical protein
MFILLSARTCCAQQVQVQLLLPTHCCAVAVGELLQQALDF